MEYDKVIQEILDVYKINASEFADKISVQRSNISHILSGRNKPSLDFLVKVKEVYPELSWDYLLLGQKPMTEKEAVTIQKVRNDQMKGDEMDKRVNAPTLFEDLKETVINEPGLSVKSEDTMYYGRKIPVKIIFFYADKTFEVFENK